MSFDITDTLAPKSDQLDAVDLLGGPRTFTIAEVTRGNDEQPVQIRLAEFPRVWRPGKSMRRVLAAAWGPQAETWTGRRVTLYCDPAVKFGGEAVGGTRISHLSHIDGPKKVPLLVTKGRSAVFTVQPLKEAAPAPAATPVNLAPLEAAFTAAGVDQGQWLTYAATVLNRAVTAPTDLTEDDAHAVIAALQAELDRRDTAQTGGE